MTRALIALALLIVQASVEALASDRVLYDRDGKVIAREQVHSDGRSSTVYGADGRVRERTVTTGSGSTWVYGADGRLLSTERKR